MNNDNKTKIVNELENYDDWKVGYNYTGDTITRRQKWYQTNNESFVKIGNINLIDGNQMNIQVIY